MNNFFSVAYPWQSRVRRDIEAGTASPEKCDGAGAGCWPTPAPGKNRENSSPIHDRHALVTRVAEVLPNRQANILVEPAYMSVCQDHVNRISPMRVLKNVAGI